MIFPSGKRKHGKAASCQRKTLERFGFSDDRTSIVNQRTAKLCRVVVVLVSLTAWFSISNHCAVGALVATKTQSAMAPMHCHGNQPSPSKKSGEEEMPCCKMLRATITGAAKIVPVASKDFLPIQSWIVAEAIFRDKAQLYRTPEELDTGPPFVGSFAESVLQRSILSHAPPLLA